MADPHGVLGVGRGASKDEIKKAYRKLCLLYHPDKHALAPEHVQQSAAASFKRVTEAYESLMDDTRRHAHTRAGFRGTASAASAGSRAYTDAYSNHFHGYGQNYSGYSQFRRRSHFDFGSVLRSFTSFSRQEALITLGAAGVLLAAAALFDPLASSFWERQNQGKLFSDIEADVAKVRQAELLRLRAEAAERRAAAQQLRQQREAAAAAATAAAAAMAAMPAAAATGAGGGMPVAAGVAVGAEAVAGEVAGGLSAALAAAPTEPPPAILAAGPAAGSGLGTGAGA